MCLLRHAGRPTKCTPPDQLRLQAGAPSSIMRQLERHQAALEAAILTRFEPAASVNSEWMRQCYLPCRTCCGRDARLHAGRAAQLIVHANR